MSQLKSVVESDIDASAEEARIANELSSSGNTRDACIKSSAFVYTYAVCMSN